MGINEPAFRIEIKVVLEGEEAHIFENAMRHFRWSKPYAARYLIKYALVQKGWMDKRYLQNKGNIRARKGLGY